MQKHTDWTEEEYNELIKLVNLFPNETYQFYADKLTQKFNLLFTYDAVRNKLRRTKRNNINFFNQKNAEIHDPRELINILIKSQKEMQKFDDRQDSVKLEIKDDKPIGIAFTGDWHIGGLYTDHEQLLADAEIIRNTDGLYDVLMGDYNDNYITRSHAGGNYEQAFTPDKQRVVCEYIFEEFFKEQTIAVLKGNHDNWSYKETGEDFVQYLARKIKSPFLWYGGEISLTLGEVEYKIHAHHTFKYNSSINTTNSQRNLFNLTHADIIALGHLHYNEIHDKSLGGRDTVWIRTGSYKIIDDYSQWIGGHRADPRVPICILFPDRKKIISFRNLYDGIEYLGMKRANLVTV